MVLTGTGRAPERYPDDEKQAGWRDIDSVAEEVRALDRRALPVISDVSDPGAVDRLLAEVLGTFGRVDIIVNNAAAARGADRVPVIDLDVDLWRTVIDVNLNGTFYMSRAFGRALAEQGNGGSIVNISSDAGKMMSASTARTRRPRPASTPSPARWHLSSVGPTCVSTRSVPASSTRTGWMTFRAASNGRLRGACAAGRASSGEDIAWMTVYLCSDQGSWITGQLYSVNGGTLTGR